MELGNFIADLGTITPKRGKSKVNGGNCIRKSFYTKWKKDMIEFDFGDSGKTAFFAVQIENEGKKGPWGPLVNALIP